MSFFSVDRRICIHMKHLCDDQFLVNPTINIINIHFLYIILYYCFIPISWCSYLCEVNITCQQSLRNFYGCRHDLVNRYRVSVIIDVCRNHNPVIYSLMTHNRICNKKTWRVSPVEHYMLTISQLLRSLPGFLWVSCCSIFGFLCNVL